MISNFVAIEIVANFDEFVYSSMSEEPFKLLLEERFTTDAFRVSHTTSKKCREDEMSDVKMLNSEEYRPLKVRWIDRTPKFNFFRVIYFICRLYFVCFYFYFIPFTSVMLSCIFP